MNDTPLIFIDIETTGTRATRDRITEIAALKINGGHVVERWVSLIQPTTGVPAHISRLTGDAPTWQTALADEQRHRSLPAHLPSEQLAGLQISAWPWPGRIILREQSRPTGPAAYHLIDHWCYLGSAPSRQAALALKTPAGQFDMDTYRILNRFIRDADQHGLSIEPLG